MDLQKLALGIELGSTRIKGVLLNERHLIVAQGFYDWENELQNGVWTYSLEKIHQGIQSCYADLRNNFKEAYGQELSTLGAIGISGMMHGYLAFDENDRLLTPFRTWRNTMTKEAAEKLSDAFSFNIPQRWSIAHLYQAILNKEEHVKDIAHLATLAVYIHYLLTGKRVAGIGEASGMFPIDSSNNNYDKAMLAKFKSLTQNVVPWDIEDLLPTVLLSGEEAGCLSDSGARFLDPSGHLQPGIPLVPPEGDAGTGMVATNAVKVGTGNVSAGTSDFAMIVSDKKLGVHREIDMVATPDGKPVAMVHCNNCTSDINAWVSIFDEVLRLFGNDVPKQELYTKLFTHSLLGDSDCGGLLSYNYFSGEGVTDFDEGRPLFVRKPNASFSLANTMKVHIMSAMATLKIGLDILTKEEGIRIEKITGHGGFFKTPIVGQKMLSAAIEAPVTCMESSGEGGAYGMALLASYYLFKQKGESLEDYLDREIFLDAKTTTVMAEKEDIEGFNAFLAQYQEGLSIEKEATKKVRI